MKFAIRAVLRMPLKDTQCGAKVFRSSLVPVLFSQEFKTRWLFDVEMFLRMKHWYGPASSKAMLLEQPLQRWVHHADSKIKLKDALAIPFQVIALGFQYANQPKRKPMLASGTASGTQKVITLSHTNTIQAA